MIKQYPVHGLLLAALVFAGNALAASQPCNFDAPARENSKASSAPMNILLVGASGMIGSRILNEAVSRGHCVIGATRNPDKIAKNPNVRAVKLDATDAQAFTALASKADAIVTATSPRGGGDPIAEAKALGDAAIAAAKASGKRLLVVGGAGSLSLPNGQPLAETLPAAYRGEALGMRGVRDSLKKSDIDWTFFSPAMMIAPGKRTTKYQLGTTTLLSNSKGESSISAEDYAHALVDELEKHAHSRQQMTIAY
jgi:putative NADH-flavin reductase